MTSLSGHQSIGSNSSVKNDTEKIDDAATDGLLGASNSLAYRVHEIEKHFHNVERWVGKLAVQTATSWADDNIDTPFRAISGANDYGADASDEAQVLGTDDTPIIAGTVKYDPFRISIVSLSTDTEWKLRLVYGSGTMATAITAGQYSEVMVINAVAGSKSGGTPVDFRVPRLNSGIDQVWLQAWNVTDNATCDFFIGVHEYIG